MAPNQALAQYIVATMYPENESIFVSDEPYRASNDFPHQPQRDIVTKHKFQRNVVAIWLRDHRKYAYTSDDVRTIWDSTRQSEEGKEALRRLTMPPSTQINGRSEVDINKLASYTAMQLNLNPLELFCSHDMSQTR